MASRTRGQAGTSELPARLLSEDSMRRACAQRDIGEVYRLLHRHGISQRQIAALSGQAQSDVSAIVNGRRVTAYALLERICLGLGFPRGAMGLAYTSESAGPLYTPVPHRIGLTDVDQTEAVTGELRRLTLRYGGGLVLSALNAHTKRAEQLLRTDATPEVHRAMLGAAAQLHRRTADAAYDMGASELARHRLLRGIALARAANLPDLQGQLLEKAGEIELCYGLPRAALSLYRLGELAVSKARVAETAALLSMGMARAYGKLGDRQQAVRAIALAREQAADSSLVTLAQLHACEGSAWAWLDEPALAIAARSAGLRRRPAAAVRSRAIDLIGLATAYLRNGDLTEGVHCGHQSLDLVDTLLSRRVRDRLAPLLATARRSGRTAADLADRIARTRAG